MAFLTVRAPVAARATIVREFTLPVLASTVIHPTRGIVRRTSGALSFIHSTSVLVG